MGGDFYSTSNRSARAASMGYATKSVSQNFEQTKVRRIHESMDPRKIRFRESRDSSVHPLTYPVLFKMDVTGSMDKIPQMLIIDGLPKMISGIIERGVTSPALLFGAIGDSRCDSAPLQIGQFESGDSQLDMWLSRTWPEGGGGGNGGESYLWAWYFAANHCATDAWDKRQEKGLLITTGDEPCHDTITRAEMKEVMDLDINETLHAKDLLAAAQKQWNVYHLHIMEHGEPDPRWEEMLGDNLIRVKDYRDIPNIVAELAAKHCSYCGKNPSSIATDNKQSNSGSDTDILNMPITL
jgi:hypothetical protein